MYECLPDIVVIIIIDLDPYETKGSKLDDDVTPPVGHICMHIRSY